MGSPDAGGAFSGHLSPWSPVTASLPTDTSLRFLHPGASLSPPAGGRAGRGAAGRRPVSVSRVSAAWCGEAPVVVLCPGRVVRKSGSATAG